MNNLFEIDNLDSLKEEDLAEKLIKGEKAEGLYFEYKQDFPQKLGKHVAAFANSYGGWIFIGIEADKTTNLPQKLCGIARVEGLKEKVRNKIVDTVNPIPLFKTGLVTLNDTTKCILIIRVEESNNPPHLVGDGRIYIRNCEGSDPVPIKDRHAVDLLYQKAGIYKEILESVTHQQYWRTIYRKPNPATGYSSKPGCSIICCPTIIKEDLIPNFFSDKTQNVIERLPAKISGGEAFILFQNSLRVRHNKESFTEIYKNGLIEYSYSFKDNEYNYPMGKISKILNVGKDVYTFSQYYGSFIVMINLYGVLGKEIENVDNNWKTLPCERDVIEIKREFKSIDSHQQWQSYNFKAKIEDELLRCFGM